MHIIFVQFCLSINSPKQHVFVVKFISQHVQTSTTSSNPTHAVSTWPPHSQDAVATAAAVDRPHTISTAYEKGHQRPALTVYTFQSPEITSEAQKSPANVLCRPPLPIVRFSHSYRSIFKSHLPFYVILFNFVVFVVFLQRCSSLERPLSSTGARNANMQSSRQCPSPLPAHLTKGVFLPCFICHLVFCFCEFISLICIWVLCVVTNFEAINRNVTIYAAHRIYNAGNQYCRMKCLSYWIVMSLSVDLSPITKL